MSYGKLGSAAPVANTLTSVYEVPDTTVGAEIDIDIINRTEEAISVELAFSITATPNAVDYVEDGAIVPANGGHLIRTSDKLSPGEIVVIRAAAIGLNIRVSGRELIDNT